MLTPTRELALQISEQFSALGAMMGLKHAVVIGGVGLLEQSIELSGEVDLPTLWFVTTSSSRFSLLVGQALFFGQCPLTSCRRYSIAWWERVSAT